MAGREKGGACKQSAHYPAHLLKKLFLVAKCQDVKWCSIAGFHMLDMFVRLSLHMRSRMIDDCPSKLSQLTNIGYTRNWYTGKQCLQTPLLCLSPAFLNPLSQITWSLQQAK